MDASHSNLWQFIPFVGTIISDRREGSPLITKLIEQGALAAAAAAIAIYVNDQHQNAQIASIVQEVRQYREDTRAQFAEVKADARENVRRIEARINAK